MLYCYIVIMLGYAQMGGICYKKKDVNDGYSDFFRKFADEILT